LKIADDPEAKEAYDREIARRPMLERWESHQQMQSNADELKAKADSLPDDHPEKDKLLQRATAISSLARTLRLRERFEADGCWEDLRDADPP
jgi:hypothetical protein